MTYTETDLVASIERLAGHDLAAVTQEQRDRFDQFHSGGSQAVDRLLPSLGLATGMTVLDVGSGLGGPARQVARTTGAAVLGIDITPAYVDAATALTETAGLAAQVRFLCRDIATLDEGYFDAAYTMHVQMNVEDKLAFFTGIAQHLRPGAPLATYEVCRVGDTEPAPPLPWSLDGSDSFLVTPGDLCDTICASGFELVEWVDDSAWVQRWFDDIGAGLAASADSATLPALLDDGPLRMLNLVVAISSGVVGVYRGAFLRAS